MSLQNIEQVWVDVGHHAYPIKIGRGASQLLPSEVSAGQKVFIVSDDVVYDLHGAQISAYFPATEVFRIGQGEASKTQSTLFEILNWLLGHNAKRGDILVAFGGGIVGDITGLAASLMKRGMPFIQVPTTLLAQVDSSVGGKTAINSAHGKNMIGAFYQPQAVYIDVDFLETLPARQISAGIAEIIKYGVIEDPALFTFMTEAGRQILALETGAITHVIKRSCEIKAQIVSADETERGQRALLNFGHTFGHALEVLNGYRPNLLHGEAVALGMGLAARYSARLGVSDGSLAEGLDHVMIETGLPTYLTQDMDIPHTAAAILDAMTQDKKASNAGLPLILARGIGQGFIHPKTDLADLSKFLESEFPS